MNLDITSSMCHIERMALTPDEVLERLNRAGATGRFDLHSHARRQMRARNIQRADVKYGLLVAASCVLQVNGRWRVPTVDEAQAPLVLACEVSDEVLVITVF